MGSLEEIEIEVDALLECSICLSQCERPTSPPCQHVFCEACLQQLSNVATSKRTGRISCPNCRQEFTKSQTRQNSIATKLGNIMDNTRNPRVLVEKLKDALLCRCCDRLCDTPQSPPCHHGVFCKECLSQKFWRPFKNSKDCRVCHQKYKKQDIKDNLVSKRIINSLHKYIHHQKRKAYQAQLEMQAARRLQPTCRAACTNSTRDADDWHQSSKSSEKVEKVHMWTVLAGALLTS